jgi:hypothetical protein
LKGKKRKLAEIFGQEIWLTFFGPLFFSTKQNGVRLFYCAIEYLNITMSDHKWNVNAETWRNHPGLKPNLRNIMPGFGTAVVLFSGYVVLDTVAGFFRSGKKHDSHHDDHHDGGHH